MSLSAGVPGTLSNVTLNSLNLTSNCSNIGLGYTVWSLDFDAETPVTGRFNDTSNPYINNGPPSYNNWWTGGPSPEFIDFWRISLGNVMPD